MCWTNGPRRGPGEQFRDTTDGDRAAQARSAELDLGVPAVDYAARTRTRTFTELRNPIEQLVEQTKSELSLLPIPMDGAHGERTRTGTTQSRLR